MSNQAILAVAGGGKTEAIVRRCKKVPRRRLLVTYTTTGQEELQDRVFQAQCDNSPEVVGWYAFLIQHFLQPYYPSFRPGSSFPGFNYEYRAHKWARGDRTFSDQEGKVGKEKLAYVARQVVENSNNAPLRRLEAIYDEIIFDEVQDLAASDLVILEWLLQSSIAIRMVGDIRQTVYESTTSDLMYKKFRGVKKIGWFTTQQRKGLLEVKQSTENYRCSSDVVALANTIFDPSYGFADAVSMQEERSNHMGLYRVRAHHVEQYVAQFSPLTLRWSKKSAKQFEGKFPMRNFGKVKGVTADHVLIQPTNRIKRFLTSGEPLGDSAASKLYVAVTRARFSVAFILDKSDLTPNLIAWSPEE